MQESKLEQIFRDAVREKAGRAYKFISPGNAGVPDRLVVLPGNKIGFVELKQKGKKPRPDQRRQLNILKQLGCVALVLDDAKQIPAVLEQVQSGVLNPDTALEVLHGKDTRNAQVQERTV